MSDVGTAIDALIARLVSATARATAEGAALVESAAKSNAPVKTGALVRSIEITGPVQIGVSKYQADIGPTIVYGRIRELGGHIVPKGHPYLAFLWPEAFFRHPMLDDGRVLLRHVYQEPRPYLKPAVEVMANRFKNAAIRRWSDAIRST